MKTRILFALALAAALVIGLAVWLHVDDGARRSVDVVSAFESDAPADEADELSAPASTRAPPAARAPAVPIEAARNEVARKADTVAEFEKKRADYAALHVIEGRITSTKDGQPVPMAVISALPPTPELGHSLPTEYRTDAFGHFSIIDPLPGRWKLTVSARGYANVERVVVLDGVQPVDADFVLTPVMQKPKLLVRLRSPTGQPLLSTLDSPYLEVARALRPVFVAQCPTRRAELPAGTSVLPIRATAVTRPVSDEWFEVALESKASACCCLMLGNHVLDVAPFDETTASVSLVASRDDLLGWLGSVRLTVIDDVSGEPITAIVEARPEIGAARRVDTDGRGYASVDHLMQGDVVVHVYASVRAPVTRKVTVRGGEVADLGVIRMVKTVDIAGWFERAESEGAFSNIYAYRIDGDEPKMNDMSTRIDSNGAFTFNGVPPGQYLLSVTGMARPSLEAVRADKVMGWAYVDARFGAVNGVRVR
jgi:hypothetical protein